VTKTNEYSLIVNVDEKPSIKNPPKTGLVDQSTGLIVNVD